MNHDQSMPLKPTAALRSTRWTILASLVCIIAFAQTVRSQESPARLSLQSTVDHVQPMTGVVLWHDHESVATDAISMEFRYCGYDEVAVGPGQWDFSKVEQILNETASRSHQAILRF
ncbi:MAG: hypothetical protein ABJ015_21415, partial [Rhodopirellula bahusiensis]